jgi:hypothetical protein
VLLQVQVQVLLLLQVQEMAPLLHLVTWHSS